MTPLLRLRNIGKSYGSIRIVDDLSLDVAAGEILALIGPSGCGKTTTLRLIGGFETPDSGCVEIAGRDVTGLAPERRGIGMVFQDYALFPHMTVAENVAFGADGGADVGEYLRLVGLESYGARYPEELSGGQQQRVALARSFAARPGLILLDEPFSNLDAALRGSTRREIRRILKATGIGIVFVTHDQEEALSFADRVAVMQSGRIAQIGTPSDLYDSPRTAFVAGFLGRTNLISGQGDGQQVQTAIGAFPCAQSGRVLLSLRPEQIEITPLPAPRPGAAHVLSGEFKGHDMTHWIEWNGLELQVDVMRGRQIAAGTPVSVRILGAAAPVSAG
ncbi:MAG: ABC transporter ATP-binding protein [Paracoccus sp. (in: a-proteobacteria)]|nr:ABC transporter ATP-binding protein [Paracoccus sp. (in: a-proteobacteria)]